MTSVRREFFVVALAENQILRRYFGDRKLLAKKGRRLVKKRGGGWRMNGWGMFFGGKKGGGRGGARRNLDKSRFWTVPSVDV
jgi:hypothetical protein